MKFMPECNFAASDECRAMNEGVAYRNLANAIVEQAASDWRRICECERAGEPLPDDLRKQSLSAIRAFFRSEWCALLCGKVNPLFILEMLEKERLYEDEKMKEDHINVKLG